jgi:hypothetical protein
MEHSDVFRAALATLAVFLIPGRAAFLALRMDRHFEGLQGWLVTAGIGAALPPLLFAIQDALVSIGVPLGGLGPAHVYGLLGISSLILLERLWRGDRHRWLVGGEWFALGIVLVVVATRAWLADQFPIPPLTDSLHHALLTREVVESGFLPDYMPVFRSIPLDRYHTGLYAISSFVSWVGAVSPLLGLIWSGQALNALAAVGVYVLLDRFASRKAAWIGLLAAGLINQMPNVYFAWGRFTQVGGQAILPIAWAVSWVWFQRLHSGAPERRTGDIISLGFLSFVLAVATVLLHLRVGIFLFTILAITFIAEVLVARRRGRARALVLPALGTALLGGLALLPRYGLGLYHWIWGHWFLSLDGNGWSGGGDLRGVNSDAYFSVWLGASLSEWVGPPLLVAAALLLGTLAIFRGNRLARLTGCWIVVLVALGSVHLLRIHVLDILPLNSVLLLGYLPLAILLGSGADALVGLTPLHRRAGVEKFILVVMLSLGLVSIPARLTDVPPEYNLVEESDLQAFAWIRENTPVQAEFAIAAYNLLPQLAVGTDGGYWIPYFTGRRTTTGPMLTPLAPRLMTRASRLVAVQRRPGFDNDKINRLVTQGVRYFYFSRSARGMVDARKLAQSPLVELVYDRDGVQIIAMKASKAMINGLRLLQQDAARQAEKQP